jgi:hypothetical protein
MADLFRTLIITAADAPLAREIAAAFGPGGSGMFTTPLSADGQEPATHYISSGYIPAEFVGLAPCTTWEWQAGQVYQDAEGTIPVTGPGQPVGLITAGSWVQTAHYPGDAATVYAYATQAGISCTLEDVEGVFSRADCSEQEPFVAMGRMGLTIINPPADM